MRSIGSARLPLWPKLFLAAFVAVMVPVYLRIYGPTNFLYFCDVALLLTLVGVWIESPLIISVCAVGIVLAQMLWTLDFASSAIGHPVTGMTAYMFSASIPLHIRALSLYHLWLPVLLLWLTWRMGYDRRAWPIWTVLAWVLVLVSYFFLPAPPAPADHPNLPVNVNYVYGFNDAHMQTWMAQPLYLCLLLVALPLLLYWPSHRFFLRFFPRAAER